MAKVNTASATLYVTMIIVVGLATITTTGGVAAGPASQPPGSPAGQRAEIIGELQALNTRLADSLLEQRRLVLGVAALQTEQKQQFRKLERALGNLIAGQASMLEPPLAATRHGEVIEELRSLDSLLGQSLDAQIAATDAAVTWRDEERTRSAERDKELRKLLESGRVKVAVTEEKE
jgi:hypothetical protein